MKPMTVRQVFYQATVRGIVEKTEAGYAKVQTDLVQMRKAGALPYDWLADNTRWQRKPRTFGSVEQALEETARFYRKSLWDDADCLRRGLAREGRPGRRRALRSPSMYDVPLMVARGYASLSFLHSAAEYINDLDVPTFIYHLGDFDPSGVNAGEKIEQTLREMAPDADIHLRAHRGNARADRRLGPADAADQGDGQPGQGLRRHLRRARRDRARSALRGLVEEAIERHLPARAIRDPARPPRQSERDLIAGLVGSLQIGGGGQ